MIKAGLELKNLPQDSYLVQDEQIKTLCDCQAQQLEILKKKYKNWKVKRKMTFK